MSEVTQSVFNLSQELLDEIERKEKSKINEHSTLHAILNIAKTPEEAILMVEYLTSLDWHNEFVVRQEGEQKHLRYQMEHFNKKLQDGAGICDWCHEFVDKLYNWPHLIQLRCSWSRWDEKSDIGSLKRYCRKCFFDVQVQLGKELKERWDKEGITAPPGQYLKFKYDMDLCDLCKRLVLWKSRFSVPCRESKWSHDYRVCLHCVEQAVEKQFHSCMECGKKSANGLAGSVCYDCKINSPYQWQVSSNISRARSAGTPATLTLKEWASTIEHFGNKCAYCRHRPFEVLEHFLPISLGGGTTAENCIPTCTKCNRNKSNRHPDTLCYKMSMFGPLFNSPTDFLPEHIEHIRQYLSSEKTLLKPLPGNNRSLVVYGEVSI